MTETTNKTLITAKGVLFYDNTCGFCRRGINRIRKALASIEVEVAPFDNGAEQPEMILRWHNGRSYGGGDAAVFLAKKFPVLAIPATIAALPPFIHAVRKLYEIVAARRHCIGGKACPIDFEVETKPNPAIGWSLTLGLVAAATLAGFVLPVAGWIHMWLIAFAMWFGFKVMCFDNGGGLQEIDLLFFFWPGMDTSGFAYENKGLKIDIPVTHATLFVGAGTLLTLIIPLTTDPTVKGWLGVAAMLCLLHFGSFVWIAALFNRRGYGAEPIMRKPWVAGGLGDFWGNRWNRAFSDWARDFLFRPFSEKVGITAGTMAGFFASGVAHELVISIPARGGYGLPTLYFLIQGLGLLVEKKLRLRRRNLARIWLWLIVLLPAPLLFHSAFIENVFNPMTNLLWNY